MLHLMHHHPAWQAANFVHKAVAKVKIAAERCTTKGCQLCTSAIEELVALHCYYNLDIASTQVN